MIYRRRDLVAEIVAAAKETQPQLHNGVSSHAPCHQPTTSLCSLLFSSGLTLSFERRPALLLPTRMVQPVIREVRARGWWG